MDRPPVRRKQVAVGSHGGGWTVISILSRRHGEKKNLAYKSKEQFGFAVQACTKTRNNETK